MSQKLASLCFVIGASTTTRAVYGQGNGLIHFSYVACSGRESRLRDCRNIGYGYTSGCSHSNDVEITCVPGEPWEKDNKSSY